MALPPFVFRPVTSETRGDFIALFSSRGAPSYCWCMVWRGSPSEKHERKGSQKKAQMLGRIDSGLPIGLIGYDGATPRIWVSIAPRTTHIRLGGPDAASGENIWSLTCMYAPRVLRGQGIAPVLIAAAVNHARAAGATIVEAYPVLPDSPSYGYMGRVPSFERAGFEHVCTAGTRRHVMRLGLG